MCQQSGISEVTISKGPLAPIGMAWTCLGPGPCWFSRSIWRLHVPDFDQYQIKWMEVHPVKLANPKWPQKVKNNFCHIYPTRILATDNASVFTSAEFRTLTHHNAIYHVTIASYHPSFNGLAEQAVQKFKAAMKMSFGLMETRVSNFLFHYRLIQHFTAGCSSVH